jgi:hypothetical protein
MCCCFFVFFCFVFCLFVFFSLFSLLVSAADASNRDCYTLNAIPPRFLGGRSRYLRGKWTTHECRGCC